MSQPLAGWQGIAGPGFATVLPDFDFETYSEAGYRWHEALQKWGSLEGVRETERGLGVVGSRVYAEHPSTRVLSLKWDLKDGRGAQWWRPGMPAPQDLFDHIARGGILEAWNSGFEYVIWTYHCVPRHGWPPLPLDQLRCAMAKARAFAMPGKLAIAGEVLNLKIQKDKEGDRLLNKFSKPRNPTKKDQRRFLDPADDPIDGPKLYAYNETDIKSEAEASSRCPDLSPIELEIWKADQRINQRGVGIDLVGIENCIEIIEQANKKYNDELYHLTNGEVTQASEIAKLTTWLHSQGVHTESLDEEHVEAILKSSDLSPHCRRALQIRQMLGYASVKKVFAMRNQASSLGRLHDLFTYYAARTGRWTGNGPQPQNLTKGGPALLQCLNESCKRYMGVRHSVTCPHCGGNTMLCTPIEWGAHAVPEALEAIATRSLEYVEYLFGDALHTISGCLRGLFVPGPDCELICSDYNAIEAVVLAALAGEEWRLEVFRTHGKIYETSASKITGISFDEFMRHKKETGAHHPMRNDVGKVAELSGGFGGWIDAWKRFGADKFFKDDKLLKEAILAWRSASPNIVEMWGGQYRGRPWDADFRLELFGLEGAAISAVLHPGKAFHHRGIAYEMLDDVLYCRLLSGRLLAYHRPRLSPSGRQWAVNGELALSFEGYNTNAQMGPVGWVRMWTYGGKLTENVVQATARDIMAHAIVNLEKAGYRVVMHVHDEIVCEVLIGTGSISEVERIMAALPPWAARWPVKASGGWRGFRYRKD